MLPLNKKTEKFCPDLGLGYLASVLRNKDHSVKLLIKDLNLSYNKFKEYLDADIVGIKVFSSSIQSVIDTIKLIRKINRKIKIVIGGPHPSSDMRNALDMLDADYAFYSEAELGFPMLIDYFKNKKIKLDSIPNLIWKDKNKIRINKLEFIHDLDSIPFPAWDLMPPKSFSLTPYNTFYKKFPIVPLTITRGCPFQCTYCNAKHMNGLKVRKRSVKNVIDELKLLYHKYGAKEVQFIDSNCIFDRGLMIEICKEMIKNKLDFSWTTPNGVRIDSIDEELLYWMKKSGCYLVSFGIESGSDRILESIKKKITVKQIREKLALVNKMGIKAFGFFMYGFPTETRKEIYETYKLSLELYLHGATFSILTPLPGTELYETMKRKGKLKNLDFNTLDFRTFRNDFSEMSPDELVKLQRKSYLRFYFRPRVIFFMLSMIKSFSYLKFLIKYILDSYIFHKKMY